MTADGCPCGRRSPEHTGPGQPPRYCSPECRRQADAERVRAGRARHPAHPSQVVAGPTAAAAPPLEHDLDDLDVGPAPHPALQLADDVLAAVLACRLHLQLGEPVLARRHARHAADHARRLAGLAYPADELDLSA